MKTKITSLLLVACLAFATSCSTILHGSKQTVTFKSNVDGKVYQNLKEIGRTNQEVKIYRRDMQKLYTIKTDGCPDKQFELKLKPTLGYWLDVPLCFTVVGLLFSYVDLALGNNVKTEKEINVTVECKGK